MNLNLMAPVNQLGYGVAGLNTLKALQSQGLNVSFFPIGQPQVVTQEDAEAVKRGMEAARLFDATRTLALECGISTICRRFDRSR